MKPVVQEHPYGCGVACVANILNIGYSDALRLFGPEGPHKAETFGFYLHELCMALRKAGWDAYWVESQETKQLPRHDRLYSIVYLQPTPEMPAGHYLVKEHAGWYNSWINYPEYPIKAGVQKQLPGRTQFLIFTRKSS